MKKFLLGAAAALALLVLAVVALLVSAFTGHVELPQTYLFANGALLVNAGYSASFLVPVGNGEAIAIDCGDERNAALLREAATARKLSLKAVLITHAHLDHVGGCKQLGAPMVALAEEVPQLRNENTKGLVSKLMGNPNFNFEIAQVVHDDEVVTFGDKRVHVFAVPGHTAGSAAYLIDGVLYFGDAAVAETDGSFAGAPWIFSDDPDAAIASLVRLAARLLKLKDTEPLSTFAFAHSGPSPADVAKLAAAR